MYALATFCTERERTETSCLPNWQNCVYQVGILDIDLCGPSIPRMLSIGRPDVHQCDSGWVPVYTDAKKSLALMSIGFLLEDPDEAVVWRGPKKTGQLFSSCSCPILVCDIVIDLTCGPSSDYHGQHKLFTHSRLVLNTLFFGCLVMKR